MIVPVRCVICGCLYQAKSRKSRYCGNCKLLKRREWKKKYRISPKGRLNSRKYEPKRQKYYEKYRNTAHYRHYAHNRYHQEEENVRKAHYYVTNAVRDGKLIRPSKCENCGINDWGVKRSMIEAHHYLGYEPPNWLKIQWLCTNCHKLSEGGGLRLI